MLADRFGFEVYVGTVFDVMEWLIQHDVVDAECREPNDGARIYFNRATNAVTFDRGGRGD